MSQKAADRRKNPRVETTLPARCHNSTVVDNSAILIDLSRTGAQVLVNKGFRGNISLEVELDLDSSVQLRGRAVWSREVDSQLDLIGVQFNDLDPLERWHLVNWVDDHTRLQKLLEEQWLSNV